MNAKERAGIRGAINSTGEKCGDYNELHNDLGSFVKYGRKNTIQKIGGKRIIWVGAINSTYS